MFIVLSSGLPISAKELLNEAMHSAFGDMVEIQELTKDTLRSRVRLSSRSVEIVLVVLDRVSADICADIENGLYQSDKYITYTNDEDFVKFLNTKYNLDLSVKVTESELPSIDSEEFVPEGVLEDIEKEYQDKLSVRDSVISNLEQRIRDLTNFYEVVEGEVNSVSNEVSEIEESLKNENISLSNELLESNARVKELEGRLSELADLEDIKNKLENRLKEVSKNYDEVLSELNELKIQYSNQSGVIRDKDTKISEIDKKLVNSEEKVFELESFIEGFKKALRENDSTISGLNLTIEAKDKEILQYKSEIESLGTLKGVSDELDFANETIGKLKDEVNSLSSENISLNTKIREKETSLLSLQDTYNDCVSKVESLEERVKSDDESLAKLNKEKLELSSRLSILEQSKGSSDDEALVKKIQELQSKLASINGNIFTRIGQLALPSSAMSARVLNGEGFFNNIRFAFSGSAESRKGSYKCLLDELKEDKSSKYLIVDLVSETSIDYVFEINKLVPGLDWFRKGGSVQPFISDTVISNIKVLSVGLGYINDSYFLCIDWVSRLQELENCGYKVVLFCGDVSNMVGRVLHESFASFGTSTIYVMGNAIGARTIITNLRGLSNGTKSKVVYFDFNETIKKFYDIVARTNDCTVVSTRNSIRR